MADERSLHGSSTRPPRPSSELGARIGSAIVLGIVALLAAYAGGWPFALFWAVAGIAIAVEWIAMTRVEPRRTTQLVLGAGIAALAAVHVLGLGPGVGVLVFGGVTLIAAAAASARRDRLWAVAGFAYAAVIGVVPPLVRDLPELGIVALLWMFAVVWTSDVAAFFTGRALGGPRLWPRVSPKKTWSGFAGGLVGGAGAGTAVVLTADALGWEPPIGAGLAILASALGSVVSQLGDLGESALKRRFDIKDSSHLIPGHGGVMDRLDGFWAVSLLVGLVLLAMRVAGS